MRQDKIRAFEMRRQGKSYLEIASRLEIPKSTLSGWFKGETWSSELKTKLTEGKRPYVLKQLKLMAEANKKKWALWRQAHQEEAVREFAKLKNNPLFLAGVMLYWGEGDKQVKNGKLRISNSDPEMLRLYYKFLVEVLKISQDKISARLIIYPDLVDSVSKNLWSRITGIPKSQFKKSTTIRGRHPSKRNSFGVCDICVLSRGLKEKMLKWIELYKQYF